MYTRTESAKTVALKRSPHLRPQHPSPAGASTTRYAYMTVCTYFFAVPPSPPVATVSDTAPLLQTDPSPRDAAMLKAAPAKELQEKWEHEDEWYSKAVQYWDKQEASVDGVLGGFGFVSAPDINDSFSVLKKVSHRSHHNEGGLGGFGLGSGPTSHD